MCLARCDEKVVSDCIIFEAKDARGKTQFIVVLAIS